MSKKFRALVGAMLSASICSSCTSSGLSNGVKWAVGVPTIGALVYFGRLGLLEMNRRKKVDICAKEIKKLVGEDNYNVLKKFYELEKENLGNSGKPVGSKLASEGLVNKLSFAADCSSYYFEYDGSSGESLGTEGIDLFDNWLGEVFRAVFVSGNCEVFSNLDSSADKFYVRVLQLHLGQVVFCFLPAGEVEIVVNSRIYGCLKVILVSPNS